jgi:dipeptidyl-peptidase-4
MTTYALTHSTSFTMGIAGGTVSDWRNYDTVYTERYMGTPQQNPEGYRGSSPRWAANSLHGSLLLIHGAIDDNVHISNTMQLVYELQKAGKPFELMLYPKSRHGVTDPALVRHLRGLMFDFTIEHLKP